MPVLLYVNGILLSRCRGESVDLSFSPYPFDQANGCKVLCLLSYGIFGKDFKFYYSCMTGRIHGGRL
jgi:hypothetical protein